MDGHESTTNLVLGHQTKNSPHNLARARLRQVGGNLNDVWCCKRPHTTSHGRAQLSQQGASLRDAVLQGNEGVDAYAGTESQ